MPHYSMLDAARILETIGRLEIRILERFPNSGLARVANEMGRVGDSTRRVVERLGRPAWGLRLTAILATTLLIAGAVAAFAYALLATSATNSLADVMQSSEAFLNEVVLVGLAVLFFVTLEGRYKRRQALVSLHRLRSIIHVIDMHQLTKDPEASLGQVIPTASSPVRTFSRDELARYLNYCSELYSLSSKLAAMHLSHVTDAVVLEAVSDIERLAAALSQKVWQKITILDTIAPHTAALISPVPPEPAVIPAAAADPSQPEA